MNLEGLRVQLEEDLAWRIDELRFLRNGLLGDVERDQWAASAMRTILVMQYAHLEGFTRNAFHLYVQVVNECGLLADDLQPQLVASALAAEFRGLRSNIGEDVDEDDGRLSRRAKNQVSFIARLRQVGESIVLINAEEAVSMEMNLGADVLRKTLYLLGLPSAEIDRSHYTSLEFVRRTRNDIAHGSRREKIEPGVFDANRRKCEEFMGDLVRLITTACGRQWYKFGSVVVD